MSVATVVVVCIAILTSYVSCESWRQNTVVSSTSSKKGSQNDSLLVDQSHGVACVHPENCNCSIEYSSRDSVQKCPLDYSLKISKVHCWNYINKDLDNSSSAATVILSELVGGFCPYNYRAKFCQAISDFAYNNDQPVTCPDNRKGRLCGKCKEGYGIAVNTGDMECIHCYYQSFPMWAAYFAIEFIYATILFLVVILGKLSLNAGGTNAFIFYCQVITMKFPGLSYPSWVLEKEYDDSYKYTIARGCTVIYSFANLDFIVPFAEPFCLSKALTPLQVITLEYIPAVYLILLTGLVYCWVVLYNRQCSIVYKLTNLIARREEEESDTNRRCKFIPNYYESLAVIVILCYTRIATTSIKFLHSSDYYNLQGEKLGKAFFYDGTENFLGDGHIVYFVAAIIVLVFFILLPALFLVFYPLGQTYFNLDCCRNSPINTNSFSGCFKDSSKQNNTKDHRYFAGVYLLIRVVIAFLYLERNIESLLIGQMSVAIVSAFLFMTFRPYKVDLFNSIDGALFVYLALLSGLAANGYHSACQKFLIHVPLVAVVVYVVFRLVCFTMQKHCPPKNVSPQRDAADSEIEPLLENGDVEGAFADRLLNPQAYVTDQGNRKTVALLDMSTYNVYD